MSLRPAYIGLTEESLVPQAVSPLDPSSPPHSLVSLKDNHAGTTSSTGMGLSIDAEPLRALFDPRCENVPLDPEADIYYNLPPRPPELTEESLVAQAASPIDPSSPPHSLVSLKDDHAGATSSTGMGLSIDAEPLRALFDPRCENVPLDPEVDVHYNLPPRPPDDPARGGATSANLIPPGPQPPSTPNPCGATSANLIPPGPQPPSTPNPSSPPTSIFFPKENHAGASSSTGRGLLVAVEAPRGVLDDKPPDTEDTLALQKILSLPAYDPDRFDSGGYGGSWETRYESGHEDDDFGFVEEYYCSDDQDGEEAYSGEDYDAADGFYGEDD
jgi:hypothetical protein